MSEFDSHTDDIIRMVACDPDTGQPTNTAQGGQNPAEGDGAQQEVRTYRF